MLQPCSHASKSGNTSPLLALKCCTARKPPSSTDTPNRLGLSSLDAIMESTWVSQKEPFTHCTAEPCLCLMVALREVQMSSKYVRFLSDCALCFSDSPISLLSPSPCLPSHLCAASGPSLLLMVVLHDDPGHMTCSATIVSDVIVTVELRRCKFDSLDSVLARPFFESHFCPSHYH